MNKWLKKFFNFKDESKEEILFKYKNMVEELSKNNSTDIFGNFSIDTFEFILEKMIFETNQSLIIFIKSYDMYFDDIKLFMLKQLANRLKNVKGTIEIITFYEKDNENLKKLSEEYKEVVQYYSFKINDLKNKELNNFLVSDFKKYILEDRETSLFLRKGLNKENNFIHNEVCFNGVNKANELALFFYEYKRNLEKNK